MTARNQTGRLLITFKKGKITISVADVHQLGSKLFDGKSSRGDTQESQEVIDIQRPDILLETEERAGRSTEYSGLVACEFDEKKLEQQYPHITFHLRPSICQISWYYVMVLIDGNHWCLCRI